tara:strand:+ start:816 stop:1154 length:339 start_codon:yes stop_codon:yes gene_type:complete
MGDNEFKITIGNSDIDSAWDSSSSYTVSLDTADSAIQNTTYTFDTSYVTDTGSEYIFNVGERRQPSDWPNEYELKEMLECYPALKIAHAKFLEVYNLVKDDYNNQQESKDVF